MSASLSAFEQQAVAALASRADLAARLLALWSQHLTTAPQTARSLVQLAQLGMTEERGAEEVLHAEEIPMSSATNFVMSSTDGAPVQTWTFAGMRANRTLARLVSTGGARVRFDALHVQALMAALPAMLPEQVNLTADELAAFRKSIKFDDCVPQELLSKTVAARDFEVAPPSAEAPPSTHIAKEPIARLSQCAKVSPSCGPPCIPERPSFGVAVATDIETS